MGTSVASSLCVRLEPHVRGSLQERIYGEIRGAILDGILVPGTRLPSSRTLAADLDVSRTTTLLAFERLIAEGYLSARPGSGTFVAGELPDDLLHGRISRRQGASNHPPMSRRGAALASTPRVAWRLGGPPRAFRIGTPALDLFPARLWTQLVNRRLRSVTLAQLDYGDAAGIPSLREAIAMHIQVARGTECDPDQIVVVAGAQCGLELACRMLLDPGDGAWLEEPGYPGARNALVGAGARIVPVRVDQDGLDVEAGARQAGDARLAYVTPSHQFPLGVPMSLARRLALLRWATRAQAWVIEDDYDGAFRYSTRPVPCLHGLDADERVIYVGSFSKTLFPALRLGFLIVPRGLREPFLAMRRSAPASPPLLDQLVLADLMSDGHFDGHLRRMRAAYRERLESLVDAADRYCRGALRLRPVRTGLHAVADLEDVDAESVFDEAAARGVEVMPLSAYYAERPSGANGLVLGFGAVRGEELFQGMEQLAAAIDAARRPTAFGGRRRNRTAQ
ncbi:MAG: aminotransferase class I/II-fold pyridoxal phosphate-dependent enzyme [Luteitalea sp.]|nr:aminotransferase class I/II-fold pyridoxal phosphate-dependent enzyme [Luteitalea sp.]